MSAGSAPRTGAGRPRSGGAALVFAVLLRCCPCSACSSSRPGCPAARHTAATWRHAGRRRRARHRLPRAAQGFLASLGLAIADPVVMLAAAGADDDLGAAAAAAAARKVVEFICLLPLTVPAIVLVVGPRAGLRLGDYFSASRRCGCSLRLRRAGAALRLPGARRRAARDRRAHAVRGRPVPRRVVVHGDASRIVLPNLRRRCMLGGLPRGRAGARRVHHRLAPAAARTSRSAIVRRSASATRRCRVAVSVAFARLRLPAAVRCCRSSACDRRARADPRGPP